MDDFTARTNLLLGLYIVIDMTDLLIKLTLQHNYHKIFSMNSAGLRDFKSSTILGLNGFEV